MTHFNFVLYTLDGSMRSLSVDEGGIGLFIELLKNFVEDGPDGAVLHLCQPATPALKERIEIFARKWSTQFAELNKLSAVFRAIPDGERFLIEFDQPISVMERFRRYSYLRAANGNPDETMVAEVHEQLFTKFEKEFAEFFQLYAMSGFGEKRVLIGEPDKNKRKCRFCKRTKAEGADFKKKAHAISESLGNKAIILAEECDDCNEFFGNSIEPHLIEYLSVHRTFLGAKGSSGAPKSKFRDHQLIFHDGQKMVVMAHINGTPEEGMAVELNSYNNFVPLNMFKALCKITLSTLDAKSISSLDCTIRWLRNDALHEAKTALVAYAIDNEGFVRHPQVTNYVRIGSDKNLPHVVTEFRLGSWVFVYVLPLSQEDDRDFTQENDYQRYWKFFKRYSSSKSWQFIDCNSREPRKLSMKIKMKPTKPIVKNDYVDFIRENPQLKE